MADPRGNTHQWWAIVTWGSFYDGPHGPWKSEAEARDALDRWRRREGADAQTTIAASCLRVVGPFHSRRAAKHADISDYRTAHDTGGE